MNSFPEVGKICLRIHRDFLVLCNNKPKRKVVTEILLDARSITAQGALLQLAFYLVNLQGIVAPYPRANLLIVEIVTFDVFLESQEKKMV